MQNLGTWFFLSAVILAGVLFMVLVRGEDKNAPSVNPSDISKVVFAEVEDESPHVSSNEIYGVNVEDDDVVDPFAFENGLYETEIEFEEELAFTDSVGSEARLLARATASMSERQRLELLRLREMPVVRKANGSLVPPYLGGDLCDSTTSDRGCGLVIRNSRTDEIVFENNDWIEGYKPTGVGQEVVRGVVRR